MFLEAAYLLVRVSSAATLPQHTDPHFVRIRRDNAAGIVGWTEAPNRRGTLDLLITCLLTLSLCVWSAMHLNVPANDTPRQVYIRFIKWGLIGIIAPELVVVCAWMQNVSARTLGIKLNQLWDEEKKRTGVCYTI